MTPLDFFRMARGLTKSRTVIASVDVFSETDVEYVIYTPETKNVHGNTANECIAKFERKVNERTRSGQEN